MLSELIDATIMDADEYERQLCAQEGIHITKIGYIVPSSSDKSKSYLVTFDGRADDHEARLWSCQCPARVLCKHIKAVIRISDAVCDEYGLD